MAYSEIFSLLVWCKRSSQTNMIQLQIVDVTTTQDIQLREGSFLLRILKDEKTGIERCLIRHVGSGREAYIQSGPKLREFVKACLLENHTPDV